MISTIINKIKENSEFIRGSYLITEPIAKKNVPELLKLNISSLIDLVENLGAPITIIGGATDLEIPAILRDYVITSMNEQEKLERKECPEKFLSYAISIEADKISYMRTWQGRDENNKSIINSIVCTRDFYNKK